MISRLMLVSTWIESLIAWKICSGKLASLLSLTAHLMSAKTDQHLVRDVLDHLEGVSDSDPLSLRDLA